MTTLLQMTTEKIAMANVLLLTVIPLPSRLFIKQSVRNSPPIGEVVTAYCCKHKQRHEQTLATNPLIVLNYISREENERHKHM